MPYKGKQHKFRYSNIMAHWAFVWGKRTTNALSLSLCHIHIVAPAEKHAASVLAEKRNVATMARLASIRHKPEPKRSLSTLAKNGQLPSRDNEPDYPFDGQWTGYKRNIGSLARGGTLNGKRNIAALAREYSLPVSGKRNLPSILRSGGGGATTSSSTHEPQSQPKRNVGAIARDNMYPYYRQVRNEKRDVSAASKQTRK